MRNINIAFAVNDDYVQHLNVTMHSVLKNNPGQKFTFFILCESLTNDSKDLISVLSEIYKNVETRIIELKSKGYGFDKFVIPESVNFITKEMYFRYALPANAFRSGR